MSRRKVTIDDGFNHELVIGAEFDGVFEIPRINEPHTIITPKGFTPFTKRHRAPSDNEALSFFEYDTRFADVLIEPERYIEVARSFPVFVPPDCSIYYDMPFAGQIANTYRSRAIGCYYQRHGANVYPLVRWGDERTYTDLVFPEPLSFAGVPRRSVVVISTYGCIGKPAYRLHFKRGLEAMLYYLDPVLVLVHGPMPDDIFGPYMHHTDFIHYSDWISRMKGRG